MLSTKLFLCVLSLFISVKSENVVVNSFVNNRPIIGILAQEQSYYLGLKYPGQYRSYIAASYVKAVESSGARVVPVWIGQNRTYYRDVMSKINGVLFPGGSTYYNQSNGYADAGYHVFRIAKEMNDNGDYFPLWGTCLGFELFAYLDAGRVELRAQCNALDVSTSLNFTTDFRNSRLFANAPDDIINILSMERVTANNHQFCITREILKKNNLDKKWMISSMTNDIYGFEFISTYENTRYPMYGVQFHPEKVSYEWKANKDINHSDNSVKANRYFMDFFIAEARKNNNSFKSVEEERKYLIYNYQATYTEITGSAFEQCYMFP